MANSTMDAAQAANGSNAVNELVNALELGEPSTDRNHAYMTGSSLYYPTERIYGGQLSAQAVMAAAKTVEDDKLPDSIHEYFLTTGKLDRDTLYDVKTLRDGRSFSTRQITATQDDATLFTALASFQKAGQTGVRFQDRMPEGLPEPESLTSAQDLMRPYADKAAFANYYAEKSPFDLRHVGGTVMLAPDKASHDADSGKQMVWAKLYSHVDVSQTTHRALLAFECDQLMMEPDLRRAGLSISTPGIFYASIDHAMWWYGDIDMSQWHLFVQDAPVAGHGRALGTGKVYTRSGELVAMMTQDAMIRVPEATAK